MGRAALYGPLDFFRGLLGDPDLLSRVGRASRLDVVGALWLSLSALVILSAYALTRKMDLVFENLPPWVSVRDLWYETDRAFWHQFGISAVAVPAAVAPTLPLVALTLKLISGVMGRPISLASSLTFAGLTLVPEAGRVAALTASKLAGPGVTVEYDLSAVYHTHALADLRSRVEEAVSAAYGFDPMAAAALSAPFLAWEAAVFYWTLRRGLGLGRWRAGWGALAMTVLRAWLSLRFPLAPWIPRLFVDPAAFSFRPAAVPG